MTFRNYFAQIGAVTSVNLMMDKMTGELRGFAFVEFSSADEADKAVEEFHNQEFQGRALTVNIARLREERPQRSGGGGYGAGGGGRGGEYGRRERY